MKLLEVKESSACVYKLIFPDGKIYVGQTKNLLNRANLYVRNHDHRSLSGVDSVISEFGLEAIEIEGLCRVVGMSEVEERLCLNILEIYYIK